jgi:hypothetical protein
LATMIFLAAASFVVNSTEMSATWFTMAALVVDSLCAD